MPRARMAPEVRDRLTSSLRTEGLPDDSHDGRGLVVHAVQRWIFEGELRDGDVLSQDDLADVLGISRIPVRDGLITLEAGGWVRRESGVGARAIGLDEASIRDSLELFGCIWVLLIRRGIERASDVDAITDAGRQVRRATDAESMNGANEAFVQALRQFASSPRLDAAYRNASRIVPGGFFSVVPDALRVQRRHVPRIATAIGNRDTDAAAALAMSQHRAHATNIVRLLESRGVLA